MVEVRPVPTDIDDNALEQTVCNVLSLTGIIVAPADPEACHRLRKKDRVIVKFLNRTSLPPEAKYPMEPCE